MKFVLPPYGGEVVCGTAELQTGYVHSWKSSKNIRDPRAFRNPAGQTDARIQRFENRLTNMLTHYLRLGLSPDASDEDIRNSYLRLVKKYTPEKEPDKFRRITEAYESLKDRRNRIRGKIFGGLTVPDYEAALLSLAEAGEVGRRRVGLQELFRTEKKQ